MHSSEEFAEYVAGLSRHCRSIVVAFANAEDQERPSDDPLFAELVGESSPYPSTDIMHFLAGMVVVARRKVAALLPEPERSSFTLAGFRQETLDESKPGSTRLTLHHSFNVIAETVPPVLDKTHLQQVLERFVAGFGFRGVVGLCLIYVKLAQEAQVADPALTLDVVLARWALEEEIDLGRPDYGD